MSLVATAMRLTLPDLAATETLARRIAAALHPGDAVLLDGPLGAGKSAFARALIRALTADPALDVPSPSYTLVQGYDTPLGPLHHFDLWRLDGPAGVVELGWDEARLGIVVVEWPERLGFLRPNQAISITLSATGSDSRDAVIEGWED